MDKQEKIVCAAVQFVYEYRNEVVMCLDYDDDRVQEHKYRDLDFGVIAPFKNGFITSKNRFVDAKEAYRIASYANQVMPMIILTDPPQYPDLKPSDLY